jgi:hypothetical protein
MPFDSDHAGDKIFGEVRAPDCQTRAVGSSYFARGTSASSSKLATARAQESTHLSAGQLEHLFALGFVIDQLQRNIVDLARCVEEWVR